MKTQDARRRIRGVKLLACVWGLGVGGWGLGVGWAESTQEAWKAALEKIDLGEDLQAVEALQVLAQGSPSGRASFLTGYVLAKIGRFEAAVPYLEQAVELHPLLADYTLLALARSHRHLGRREEAASALQRLLQEHPESLLREKALRELGLDYAELGNLVKAEAAYLLHLAQFPGSPHRPAVLLALAQVLLKAGKLKEAEQLFRQLYLEEPGTKEAQKAKALLASIPQAQPLTSAERWKRAVFLHQLGLHSQAIAELSPFAEGASPYASKARLLIGISFFQLKGYEKAAEALLPLAETASPFQDEVLYWLGRSLGRLGKSEKALAVFQALYTSSPKSPKASDALYFSGLIHEDEGRWDQALRLYDQLLKAYPRSDRYEEALWRRGWIHLKEKAYRKALRDFRALAEQRGSPFADQALYWQGRTKELMKKPKEAAGIYRGLLQSSQSDYYQLRAREAFIRLTGGRSSVHRKNPSTVNPQPPTPNPQPLTPRLAKARELYALRLKKEAVEEYWELALAPPDDLGLLGEALSCFVEAGHFDKALWIAKKVLKPLYLQRPKAEPIPGFWDYLFPLGYFPLIKTEASAVALDPYLVLAVIREESAFQKDAVSMAGARGLMQLLPQTAELMAKEVKLEKPSINGLDSPPLNIALGIRYLSQLLQEFSGDLALALAAYNAGPHQVRRWLEKYGYTSPEVFIEEIPFQETRGYVKRVLGSYDRYLALYRERKE